MKRSNVKNGRFGPLVQIGNFFNPWRDTCGQFCTPPFRPSITWISSWVKNSKNPKLNLDDRIRADQEMQKSVFSRKKRATISPHEKIHLANFTSFINNKEYA